MRYQLIKATNNKLIPFLRINIFFCFLKMKYENDTENEIIAAIIPPRENVNNPKAQNNPRIE